MHSRWVLHGAVSITQPTEAVSKAIWNGCEGERLGALAKLSRGGWDDLMSCARWSGFWSSSLYEHVASARWRASQKQTSASLRTHPTLSCWNRLRYSVMMLPMLRRVSASSGCSRTITREGSLTICPVA
jgi:hypothetical protein